MPDRARWTVLASMAALALAACQSTPPPPTTPEAVGEYRPGSGYLKGYLDSKQLPDSLALLPPPPAAGSAQAADDAEAYRSTRKLRDTPRWAFAVKDANLKFPAAADTFSCALDIPISQEATPHLNMLLRRTLLDAGLATYKAKNKYNRPRPFMAITGDEICTPAERAALEKDGSYPSGHSALGWAWALVLAEVAPERQDAILARGYAFSRSRVICGVHWESDTETGRLVGAAAVARLHAEPTFREQLRLAKAEVDSARAAGRKSALDCKAEAAALAIK